MKSVLKYFAKRSFNTIDTWNVAISAYYFSEGRFMAGALVMVGLLVLSVAVEFSAADRQNPAKEAV